MRSTFILAIVVSIVFNSACQTAQAQHRHRGHGRHTVKVTRTVVHRKVVVRKAHVRYAGLPKWRSIVTVVPTAAIVVKAKRHPYYFHNGIYYAHRNTGYVVVRPVPGVRIRTLPVGYRPIVSGPHNYFYYYGTFYTQIDNTAYEVIDAPEGAIVDALPDGYEVKNIDGTEYYVLDGVYYAEVEDNEMIDGVGYEVVKI